MLRMDKTLPVTTLGVPAHQTPDFARPSLKPGFPLYLMSPSPFFEFGLVSIFLIDSEIQLAIAIGT